MIHEGDLLENICMPLCGMANISAFMLNIRTVKTHQGTGDVHAVSDMWTCTQNHHHYSLRCPV